MPPLDHQVLRMRVNAIERRVRELAEDIHRDGVDVSDDSVAKIVTSLPRLRDQLIHMEDTLDKAIRDAPTSFPPPNASSANDKRKRDTLDDDFDAVSFPPTSKPRR